MAGQDHRHPASHRRKLSTMRSLLRKAVETDPSSLCTWQKSAGHKGRPGREVGAEGKNATHKNHQGVYTLIIRLAAPCRIAVGRHLAVLFKRGLYLYTGSALGRGSTSLEGRISRHLSRHKNDFWHIDRILSSDSTYVVSVILAKTTSKAECKVNRALLMGPNVRVLTKGIGCSDCKCESHFLAAAGTLSVLRRKVRLCYTSLGLRPRTLKCLRTNGPCEYTTEMSRPRSKAIAQGIRTRRSMSHQ